MDIIEKLVEIRKERKIKTREVLNKTGLSRTTLFRLETKRVDASFESVLKYANCLGFDLTITLKDK